MADPKKPKAWILLLLFPLLFMVWGMVYFASPQSLFEDPALEQAIREETGIMDRQLEIADLTNIDRLALRDHAIRSLKGIEAASNLRSLDVRDNQIDDLTPVQQLISLEELNVRGNQIEDLSPLRPLSDLRHLNVRENRIADIQPLSDLERLADVNIRYNQITDLSPLVKLDDLRVRLFLEGNPLEDTSPLKEMYDDILDKDFPLVSGEVQFSEQGGFHREALTVELNTEIDDATIYYTLDGSTPDQFSTVYEDPLLIESRADQPNDLSAIPINERDDFLAWMPPSEKVFKGTVIRAIAIADDIESQVSSQSYFIDEASNDRYDVPVISLSTEKEHLFDDETGLFVNQNYLNRGDAWERPVQMEYYEADGELAFTQQLGMRIHGGSTRHAPIKSLRFYARTDYDFTRDHVQHQFFPDKDQDIFERFLLRYRGTEIKDGMQAHLIKDVTNLDLQYSQPAVVFINGEYWGVYNIRDRFDNNYIETHYGIEDVDIMTELNEVSDGDSQHFDALLSYLRNRQDQMNDPDVYDMVKARMDLENFRDFSIFQMYIMNVDQPGKNLDFWRSRTLNPEEEKHDGRWRWMVYDLDMGFGNYGGLGIDPFVYQTSQRQFGDETVLSGAEMAEWEPRIPDFSPVVLDQGPESTFKLRTLLKNDRFRLDFMNRFADLMNTSFTHERVVDVIDEFDEIYRPLVDENASRLGEPDEGQYDESIETLIAFSANRSRIVRNQAVEYFPEINGLSEIMLTSDSDKGAIRINSITLNEMTHGMDDEPFPWQGTYFSGIPIELEAVPYEGYTFAGWNQDISEEEKIITLNLEKDAILNVEALFE